MEQQRYCVYNQTSECFLSLGVTLGDNTLTRLKGLLNKGSLLVDEGCWITRPSGFSTMGLVSSRDLIYLDENHKVIDVIESFPSLRVAPQRSGADSLLGLPVRTVYSSQTQPGNQLVICLAEEMEFRLRSLPGSREQEIPARTVDAVNSSMNSPKNWLPQELKRDRRGAARKRLPRLVAYDSRGSELTVLGVRDISATGLYLMTGERWPLGSHVKMNLQRTDGMEDKAAESITVDLRVCRWGSDGVALEFVQSDPEQAALMAMHVHG